MLRRKYLQRRRLRLRVTTDASGGAQRICVSAGLECTGTGAEGICTNGSCLSPVTRRPLRRCRRGLLRAHLGRRRW